MFYDAEEAAEEAVERILKSGSSILYDEYLENRCYGYVSRLTCNLLMSHVNMCYVSCDSGENGSGGSWTAVPEPFAPDIDTCAKCSLVLRNGTKPFNVKSQIAEPVTTPSQVRQKQPGNAIGSVQVASSLEADKERIDRLQIPWIEKLSMKYSIDEEEGILREIKEKQNRKKFDEEVVQKQKTDNEAEQVARLNRIREELKTHAYSHDSDGNIIWVENLDTSKLPSAFANPVPKLRGDGPQTIEEVTVDPPTEMLLSMQKKIMSYQEAEDSFSKFNTQQPPAVSMMNIKPGVTLTERGKALKGPEMKKSIENPSILSRSEYLQLVRNKKQSN